MDREFVRAVFGGDWLVIHPPFYSFWGHALGSSGDSPYPAQQCVLHEKRVTGGCAYGNTVHNEPDGMHTMYWYMGSQTISNIFIRNNLTCSIHWQVDSDKYMPILKTSSILTWQYQLITSEMIWSKYWTHSHSWLVKYWRFVSGPRL